MTGFLLIDTDSVWTSGSVHNLTGVTVQIAPGATLKIEGGATVTGGIIEAYGTLNADGEFNNPVEFEGVNLGTRGGVGRLDIDHVHMVGGSLQNPTGQIGNANMTLTNSVFVGLGGYTYVWYPGTPVLVENNLFIGSGGFSVGTSGIASTFRNNTFVEQTGGFAIENWNTSGGMATLVEGNNFLSTDRVALQVKPGGYDFAKMTAEGNYFGTSNPGIIDGMVRDRTDSLSYSSVIDVEPFLGSANPDAPAYALGYVPVPLVEVGDPLVIYTDSVWTSGSVHNLTGVTVQIAPGATLKIEGGATVTGGIIEAYGTLNADGESGNLVELSGVALRSRGNVGSLNFDYVHMVGGNLQNPTGQGDHANMTLTNSVFENLGGYTLVWYPNVPVLVENNLFLRSGGFSVGSSGVATTFRNNTFVEQAGGFAIENWAAYGGAATLVEGNNFLSTDRVALQLPAGYDSAYMSAEGNYFGTTNANVIDGMVRDRTDSLAYHSVIDIQPSLTQANSNAPVYGPFWEIGALIAEVQEGHSNSSLFTFEVWRSGDTGSQATLDWSVVGSGSAGANAGDFVGHFLPAGTLSFAPDERQKIVVVQVAGDTVVEFDEGFTVALSNPSLGLTLGTASATGTIQNDDRSAVSIAPLSAGKAEGSSGTTPFTFTVNLNQASVASQTVSWAVTGSGGNPADALDFASGVLPFGTVTFAVGETTKTITVGVAGDVFVEAAEGFTVTLSTPTPGLTLGTASATGTIQNDDVAAVVTAHGDAYIVHEGQSLTVDLSAGLLANDLNASTASLLGGPAHGSLQLVGSGNFSYTPVAGFQGIDSFAYQAGNNGSSMGNEQAVLYVVPVNVGATTTLDLLALTAEEQIAATYVAFFGRAADAGGLGFWVNQFITGLPVQGPAALFANIASSFGISAEAKALYPFLANPFGASDSQISTFLDSVYQNLFNRSSDAAGLAYWTDQTKATLQAGQFVGSILVNIMGGAQDTAAGRDITTLMGKVAVSLDYVQEQQERGTVWAGASDTAAATTLLQAVTSDPLSVLVGVRNAENLIAAHA